ncbi:hypothetical protein HK105_208772 [Polyrhizophydium stewartii]|uniref:PIG-P domain-containing protein n=1 Tax=Polyrhizophydium stewartii TaxID=2732419 RepID=A0ABR4MWW3_9FUNG
MYCAWVSLPDSVLHGLQHVGIPSRHWALVIPLWILGLIPFTLLMFTAINLLRTPPFDSFATVTDEHAHVMTSASIRRILAPELTPKLEDVPLSLVNRCFANPLHTSASPDTSAPTSRSATPLPFSPFESLDLATAADARRARPVHQLSPLAHGQPDPLSAAGAAIAPALAAGSAGGTPLGSPRSSPFASPFGSPYTRRSALRRVPGLLAEDGAGSRLASLSPIEETAAIRYRARSRTPTGGRTPGSSDAPMQHLPSPRPPTPSGSRL